MSFDKRPGPVIRIENSPASITAPASTPFDSSALPALDRRYAMLLALLTYFDSVIADIRIAQRFETVDGRFAGEWGRLARVAADIQLKIDAAARAMPAEVSQVFAARRRGQGRAQPGKANP